MRTFHAILFLVCIVGHTIAQSGAYSYSEGFKTADAVIPDTHMYGNENNFNKSSALDGNWSGDFTIPGIIGPISSIANDGTNLYFGGQFRMAGSVYAQNIVKWDGQKWTSGEGPENGVGNTVQSIVYADGKLFAGGLFSAAGSLEANGIAYWDGSKWNTLGSGMLNGLRRYIIIENDTTLTPGFVYELFAYKNKIYVGGYFHLAGDNPANGVAIWDIETETWESPEGGFLGTTATDPVYAYAFAARGDSIFVGGKFHYAGNEPMQHIAVWDGSTWSSLGEAAGYIYDLDFDSKGNLYAVGYYPAHEADSISGIGIWNGTGWESLEGPAGFEVSVNRIKIKDDVVYAAGHYFDELTNEVTTLARWEINNWEIIRGLRLASNELVYASGQVMEFFNGKLYFAGNFTRADENFPVNVAALDPLSKTWSKLDDRSSNLGIHDGYINALVKSKDGIYAGGSFSVAGSVVAKNVAELKEDGWHSLGKDYENGIRGEIFCMVTNGDSLFVGGHFGSAGTHEAYHIAMWDGTAWHPVGIGVGGVPGAYVKALALVGDYLYAGGYFSIVGDEENYDLEANSIARYNLVTKRWETIGNGIELYEGFPGNVDHLEVSGNQIFVTGQFNIADRRLFKNVAVLTNNKWSGFEENEDIGVDGIVRVIKKINNEIYIGGRLFPNGSTESKGLLKWGGKTWIEQGEEFFSPAGNSSVLDIKPFRDGFIVSGLFQSIGNTKMNNIAWFDGIKWYSIGEGIQPLVTTFEVSDQQLYAAGTNVLLSGETAGAGLMRFDLNDPGTYAPVTETGREDMNLYIYPNPATSLINLQFIIQQPGEIRIALFNLQGMLMKSAVKEQIITGDNTLNFYTGDLPEGVYLVRLSQGILSESRVVVLK